MSCLGLEVLPLLTNRLFERRILADGDAKGIGSAHPAFSVESNSRAISALCSPMRGAPMALVSSSPSMRMGQRVVRRMASGAAADGLHHVEGLKGLVIEEAVPGEHVGAPDVGRFEDVEPVLRGLVIEDDARGWT